MMLRTHFVMIYYEMTKDSLFTFWYILAYLALPTFLGGKTIFDG